MDTFDVVWHCLGSRVLCCSANVLVFDLLVLIWFHKEEDKIERGRERECE